MTRSLLLKGLAGVAALGGTVGGLAFYRKEIFGGWGKGEEEPKSENVSGFSQKELIDKVGLDCGLEGNELTDNTPKDCNVKNNETIKVKIGDKEEEGVTFTTNGSKLKVSKSEEVRGDGGEKYNKKLKFVVDSGDISLNKTGGSSSIPKLEQFETYEVFLRDKKFYLRRKTDAKEEKIKALGLPTGKDKCYLPESGDSNCTLTIEEAKKVKFENHTGGVTISTGEVRLKISKMTDSDSDFGESKYRFTFTFPSEVTINTKKIKANTPYDFKIKKGSGNSLTLERAWSDDKEFAKKAGLKCEGNNNECTVPADSQNLNVKVGDKTKEGISSISTGKIKMETEQEGYNQGLKFTITTADISISSVAGEIQKLEELETYEITEEGGKYYLTRKTSKEESIRSSLSIPEECFTATGGSCTLSQDAFKAINFEGKSNASASGNITLKISKTSSADFPLGYRFTFNTATEATITASSNTIKANIPTDFKIKKEEGKVSLEKAWSDTNYSFAAKVGLECTDSNGCCTKTGSEKLNVKKGTEKKDDITSIDTSGTSKIKVEKDQAGYNQGLKFTISGGNVSLTGGSGASFSNLEELETYEITEEGDKYYLTRKNEASETIMSLLGLADAGCSLSSSSSTCSNLTTDKLKKIKFDGKDATGPSIASSGTATLTIAKTDKKEDFPLGYKFTLQSGQEITIKTGEKVAANISTDFKIKKAESGQTPALSLEKAWTAESLGKKVGLNCTSASGGDECCTMTSGGKLNVKQGSDKKDGITSFSGGKIKVEKDQAGYNQGLKFTIDGGDLSLTGGNKVGSSSPDITKLGEYETYEIKEEGGKWYLARKHESIVFLKKALGFEFCSDDTFGGIFTCEIEKVEDLKKIKFHNMGSFSNWPKGSIYIELAIEKETNGEGLKFTFNKKNKTDDKGNTVSGVNTSATLCIPDGKGGSLDLKSGSYSNSGAEYKIKKGGTDGSLCLEPKDGGGSSTQCTT